jgi:hypothetical protein
MLKKLTIAVFCMIINLQDEKYFTVVRIIVFV